MPGDYAHCAHMPHYSMTVIMHMGAHRNCRGGGQAIKRPPIGTKKASHMMKKALHKNKKIAKGPPYVEKGSLTGEQAKKAPLYSGKKLGDFLGG